MANHPANVDFAFVQWQHSCHPFTESARYQENSSLLFSLCVCVCARVGNAPVDPQILYVELQGTSQSHSNLEQEHEFGGFTRRTLGLTGRRTNPNTSGMNDVIHRHADERRGSCFSSCEMIESKIQSRSQCGSKHVEEGPETMTQLTGEGKAGSCV